MNQRRIILFSLLVCNKAFFSLKLLKFSENENGENNLETVKIVSSLAILLKKQNKYESSEEMYVRALKGYEEACGVESKEYLSILNNLGILYKSMEKPVQCREMYDRALEGRLALLGTKMKVC